MANFPTEGDDIINGNGGDDRIDALGGNDVVRGGWGDDILLGGAGDDRLYGDGGDDLLVGNTGSDRMIGGDGSDTMVWNNGDGSDQMDGGDGYDTTIVNGADTAGDAFTIAPGAGGRVDFDRVNLVPFSLDIGETERLVVNGQGGDDEITGGPGLAGLIKLVLNGDEGNDEIFGGDGDDALYGGTGNDHLEGFRGNDRMIGGWGNDVMEWDNGDGSDLMEGGEGYDTADVDGSETDGDHFVIAADGGRVAFDRVNLVPFGLDIGSTEKLVVEGLGGNDVITAGDGLKGLIKLKLYGGDGHDVIQGGNGDDWISGGDGNDWLSGGKGYDTLVGGAGADTFVFDKGRDVIADFEDGVDTIIIHGYGWINDYADIEDRIEDHGSYVEIDLGRHELKIEGADASWFSASDFDFA